jgi:hypothetical protein
MAMVAILVQLSTRYRSISRAAVVRSHRVIITVVAPRYMGMFMLPCMPVTWNRGSVPSTVLSWCPPPHSAAITTVLITVAWVWMHPFGRPVVPEV